MSVQVAPELDYSEKSVGGGSTYKFTKIFPNETQSITGQATGTTACTFELPDVGMNLSKSILSFIWKQPEVNAKYLFLHSGCVPHIDNITLSTKGGVVLAEIKQVGNFTRLVMPYTTPLKRFLNKSVNRSRVSAALCVNDQGDTFHRSDVLKSTAPTADGVASGFYVQADRTIAAGDLSYTGPCELMAEVKGDGANAGDGCIKVQLMLGELIHTLFAVNKTLVFGQKLVVSIQLQQGAKVGFTGDALSGNNGAVNAVALVSNPVVTSILLYLATEQNAGVVSALRQKVAEGFNMPCPYVYMQKMPLILSATNSVRWSLNRTQGQKLRRVYNGIFSSAGSESGIYSYLRSNNSAAVCTAIRSYFMSVARQDYSMSVTDGEPFMALKELIDGSTIQSATDYLHRFAWIDDWSGMKTADEGKEDWDSGLELVQDSDYTIELAITANGALGVNLFQYAWVQKTLSIKDNQVLLL